MSKEPPVYSEELVPEERRAFLRYIEEVFVANLNGELDWDSEQERLDLGEKRAEIRKFLGLEKEPIAAFLKKVRAEGTYTITSPFVQTHIDAEKKKVDLGWSEESRKAQIRAAQRISEREHAKVSKSLRNVDWFEQQDPASILQVAFEEKSKAFESRKANFEEKTLSKNNMEKIISLEAQLKEARVSAGVAEKPAVVLEEQTLEEIVREMNEEVSHIPADELKIVGEEYGLQLFNRASAALIAKRRFGSKACWQMAYIFSQNGHNPTRIGAMKVDVEGTAFSGKKTIQDLFTSKHLLQKTRGPSTNVSISRIGACFPESTAILLHLTGKGTPKVPNSVLPNWLQFSAALGINMDDDTYVYYAVLFNKDFSSIIDVNKKALAEPQAALLRHAIVSSAPLLKDKGSIRLRALWTEWKKSKNILPQDLPSGMSQTRTTS